MNTISKDSYTIKHLQCHDQSDKQYNLLYIIFATEPTAAKKPLPRNIFNLLLLKPCSVKFISIWSGNMPSNNFGVLETDMRITSKLILGK
jgi:hypothetical protein